MACRSIFFVHWDTAEAEAFAEPMRSHGCEVVFETEDGDRAFQLIREIQPSIVLIFLSRLPSHGRTLARAIREDAKTREIPLVFVGGKQWSVEQARSEFPGALFIGPENICAAILPIIDAQE